MEELDVFSNKCPYPKQEVSDHEESCCHKIKAMDKKFKKKNENFYSKEDSDDESKDAESYSWEYILKLRMVNHMRNQKWT